MKLLLVLLVLAGRQFFPGELALTLGRFSRQWRDIWTARRSLAPLPTLALIILLPAFVLGLVLYGLDSLPHGVLLSAPLALAVLGLVLLDRHWPEAVARYRDSWLSRNWSNPASPDQPDLIPPEASMALELGAARRHLMAERLAELFSPLFWFLLLGPVAVLAYYLVRITAELAELHPAGALARQWQYWADWPASRVLALSFALAGNFVETWNLLKARLADWQQAPVDLLDEAAAVAQPLRATAEAEVSQGATLVLGLSEVDALLQRALGIWIVLLALHTLWP